MYTVVAALESIKRSGGGVSEPGAATVSVAVRVYQAFRWWGVGTTNQAMNLTNTSLSSVPVVGCRNVHSIGGSVSQESIKRSGGGVSELYSYSTFSANRVYQAFRWWGVGTVIGFNGKPRKSLSTEIVH